MPARCVGGVYNLFKESEEGHAGDAGGVLTLKVCVHVFVGWGGECVSAGLFVVGAAAAAADACRLLCRAPHCPRGPNQPTNPWLCVDMLARWLALALECWCVSVSLSAA